MSNCVWVIVAVPKHSALNSASSTSTPDQDSKLNIDRIPGETINHGFVETDEPGLCISKPLDQSSLEQRLRDTLEELRIVNCVWSNGESQVQAQFACDVDRSDAIIQRLLAQNIGNHPDTFVGMLPFALAYNSEVITNPSTDHGKDDWNESMMMMSNLKLSNDSKSYTKSRSTIGTHLPGESAASPMHNGKKTNAFQQMQEKFIKSVSARLTVAQVVQNVQSGAELTFDFSVYVLMAAWLAAIGLIENSLVCLVASMLVSPMMGPLMALTFGSIVQDRNLRRIGIINMVIGFAGCIVFGLVFGLLVFNFTDEWNHKQTWPTIEMNVRGQLRTVLVGALVALPSGAAVAISLLSGNQSSLVGVAISASLLPPCVNTGLLWAFGLIKLLRAYGSQMYGTARLSMYNSNHELAPMEGYDWTFSPNMAIECGLLGVVSLALALVNVICIYLAAYLLLKIKEVMPLLAFASSPKQRFWSEHVKIARNYRKISTSDAPESLGKELLEEWARINGLDVQQLLSNEPEAKVTQLHTLQDILSEAEDDEVFQTIVNEAKSSNQNVCRKPYESSPVTQRRASCLKVPGRSLNADLESGTNTLSRTDATTSMHSQADTRRPSQQLRSYIRRLSINPSLVASNDSLTNSNRGLDAAQLSMNQRNFERLQTSLKQTDHLPYSLWPRRKSDISHLSPLSRSTQHHRAQRFSITPVLSTLERGDPTQDQGAPSSAPGCTSKSAIDKEVFKF